MHGLSCLVERLLDILHIFGTIITDQAEQHTDSTISLKGGYLRYNKCEEFRYVL